LETINVDLKRARTNLLLSLGVPQFPESQWTKLLSGGTADFDHVLSGIYAKVTDYGDWTTAFDSFLDAFTFIFPHRRDELREYAEHVKAFFKARPVSEHSGVFAYDSAVRTRVAQKRNLLHTNYLQFQDLQIRFIFSPFGGPSGTSSRVVESSASTSAGRRKQS
ncbi:hypothetical protein FISHEDRAFT_34297, partial [Fistulina hepatica ATCC 64428]